MRRALVALLCGLVVLPAGAAVDPAGTKAIGFSILEDYEKGEPLTDVARDFALFHELGVTTWRGSFAWDHYEPARGRYDFAWLERFADLAAARGITLRPYLAYTPQWAAAGGTDKDAWNDPPRRLDDWSHFVGAAARAMRRHPNVVSFEIYNEENMPQWWDGTPAAYNAVLRRAFEAARAANPRLQVIMGGMVYPDPRWVGYACGTAHNARRFAILAFHAYPETWTPPEVDVEHYLGDRFGETFVQAADAACGPKPIWINEAGLATTAGRSEADQADWWARAVPTFAAAPRVEHLGIYEIKDLAADRLAIGDAANYHLGITYADRRKKMAFRTLQRLVAMFARAPVRVADAELRLSANGGDVSRVYRHLFVARDGRQLLFLWSKTEPITVDVTLPRTGRVATQYDLEGAPSAVEAYDGRTLAGVSLDRGRTRMFEVLP